MNLTYEVCRIGSGQKLHLRRAGLGPNTFPTCGSAKWNSRVRPVNISMRDALASTHMCEYCGRYRGEIPDTTSEDGAS